MKYFFAVVLLMGCLVQVDPAKILALFPFNGKSHFVMFSALLRGLAERGHEVTVLSHFPREKPIPNYKDLDVRGGMQELLESVPFEWLKSLSFLERITFVWLENEEVCHILNHPHAQELLRTTEKYDVIITEIFSTDCFLGFAYKFQIPLISMTSSVTLPWANDRMGNPDHPGYIPSYYLPYTDKMTFAQRFVNTMLTLGVKIAHKYLAEAASYEIAKNYFGDDLPPLSEIAKNTSIVFVNSHFSLNQPRPFVPAVVEVGGLHIEEPKKLPKDLESYLNESEHGVVLFSFGSLVNCTSLPKEKIHAMLDAFAKLKQRVLWKVSHMEAYEMPRNVKTASWIPQLDVLSHPKVRAFITHGGLMGTQEAVYAGVPLVGIPLFADQHLNVEKYATDGIAVKLEYDDISEQSVSAAIDKVLNDPRYKENAERVSRAFRDRPETPLQTAIFWTEYVIRHKGAPHLRSAATDLPWYQLLLLDVAATFILICGVFIYTMKVLIKLSLKKFLSIKEKKS